MRALELQRLIEDKVSEWRERSARVAGASVADSYQQPVHFRRHANRRKNSAEINKIIAKYSKPIKRTDESYVTHHSHMYQELAEPPPVRPARQKKTSNLKYSKSEDNLANLMDRNPDPTAPDIKPPPRFKYKTKSYEDITAFFDVGHKRRSKNFEENSILNAKTAPNPKVRLRKLKSIEEDILDVTEFKDSAIELRSESGFMTSTPVSKRKTYSDSDSVSLSGFQKCLRYATGGATLRKGASEPDMLSACDGSQSVLKTNKTSNKDSRKKWKLPRPQFRTQAFAFLIPWRAKKTAPPEPK